MSLYITPELIKTKVDVDTATYDSLAQAQETIVGDLDSIFDATQDDIHSLSYYDTESVWISGYVQLALEEYQVDAAEDEVEKIEHVVDLLNQLSMDEGNLVHLEPYIGYLDLEDVTTLLQELPQFDLSDYESANNERDLLIKILQEAKEQGCGLLISSA